jgi:uncharacterized protein YlxW (UPF0749 family)
MIDLNAIFAETLNKAVASAVAAAVTAATEEHTKMITMLTGRTEELLQIATDLEERLDSAEREVSELKESAMSERNVETFIDEYDFSEIVNKHIDTRDLFASDDFADAVREVIVGDLRR